MQLEVTISTLIQRGNGQPTLTSQVPYIAAILRALDPTINPVPLIPLVDSDLYRSELISPGDAGDFFSSTYRPSGIAVYSGDTGPLRLADVTLASTTLECQLSTILKADFGDDGSSAVFPIPLAGQNLQGAYVSFNDYISARLSVVRADTGATQDVSVDLGISRVGPSLFAQNSFGQNVFTRAFGSSLVVEPYPFLDSDLQGLKETGWTDAAVTVRAIYDFTPNVAQAPDGGYPFTTVIVSVPSWVNIFGTGPYSAVDGVIPAGQAWTDPNLSENGTGIVIRIAPGIVSNQSSSSQSRSITGTQGGTLTTVLSNTTARIL